MTSVMYWTHLTKTDDFYRATSIANRAVGYGLAPEFICSRGLFGNYWLCRISMVFDERDSTDSRRVEEIGRYVLELSGDIALRDGQAMDDVFSLNVEQH